MEYPRDSVQSNDVPAIDEFAAITAKIKAGLRIKPEEFDQALADYRHQLNTKWLPVLNDIRAEAKATKAALEAKLAELTQTLEDFKTILAEAVKR